ncbi:MAG: dUTP diphosphatase, partial [Muribaculaceae bacterium]|nr:dUTP diphosphatase [Muribaculaceae bacterium]
LSLKHGLTVLKSPGTIDADYRGEIGVILINLGEYDYEVKDGERICQMVIKEYTKVEWELTDRLDRTRRDDGGFGHTGTN